MTEDFNGLDEISARFIRAVQSLMGDQVSLDVLEALTPILGGDWARRVVFNRLADNFSTIENITIVDFDHMTGRKINAIKTIRTLCLGLGLKEAKDIIENAQQGKKHIIRIDDSMNQKWVKEQVRELQSFGVKVVIT